MQQSCSSSDFACSCDDDPVVVMTLPPGHQTRFLQPRDPRRYNCRPRRPDVPHVCDDAWVSELAKSQRGGIACA